MTELNSMDINASIQLANRYYHEGKMHEASDLYVAILKRQPNNIDALMSLGGICYQLENYDLAMDLINKVIHLNPSHAKAYYLLGITLKEKGLLDEAMLCYQKALELDPHDAFSYSNMGNVFLEKCRVDDALRCYEVALQLNPHDPHTHWHMAVSLLLSGDLVRGWEKYEWRFKAFPLRYLRRNSLKSQWDGTDISGQSILLSTEQGFGDALQFVRYAPMVAERGAKVILECQQELVSLFKHVDGISDVMAYGAVSPDFDVYCPLLSLPFILGTTLENIPANIPYIRADLQLVQEWKNKLQSHHSRFKIGIVWSSRPGRLYEKKSIPLALYSSLTSIDGLAFFSLQKGEAARQIEDNEGIIKLIDYSEDMRDFSDTAAFIENLDLVISVDTAVAHLAGALGKPVWLLLSFFPDWRWLLYREDSPWYPTMRIFRQPSRGDWISVIARIKDELSKLVGH